MDATNLQNGGNIETAKSKLQMKTKLASTIATNKKNEECTLIQ